MPTKPTLHLTQNNFFLAALLYARGFPPFRFRSSRFPHSLAVVQSSGRLRRGSNPCRACLKKNPSMDFFLGLQIYNQICMLLSRLPWLYIDWQATPQCATNQSCQTTVGELVEPRPDNLLKIFPKLSVHKLKIFCDKKNCKACKQYFYVKSDTFGYLVYGTEV